jgi:hypothetical protein
MTASSNPSLPRFENIASEDVYPLIGGLLSKVTHVLEGVILHSGQHPTLGQILIVESAIGLSALFYPALSF